MLKEAGQIILTIILVMTVILSVGLSVVQKSLTDISTSTTVEQSSRAFSAAEAGIEKALQGDSSGVSFKDNASSSQITDSGLIPVSPAQGTRQEPLESDPLSREEIIQFWLADYTSTRNPPAIFYNPPSPTPGRKLDIFWGSSSKDKAALELTLISYNTTTGSYEWRKWYLDQVARTPANGFCQVTTCTGGYSIGANTYQCKKTLGDSTCPNVNINVNDNPLPTGLMAIRARLLYNDNSQPVAIQAEGTCGKDCSLPAQKRDIISVGSSGNTQRKVKVSQWPQVVPFYFDYAIFSAGDIKK